MKPGIVPRYLGKPSGAPLLVPSSGPWDPRSRRAGERLPRSVSNRSQDGWGERRWRKPGWAFLPWGIEISVAYRLAPRDETPKLRDVTRNTTFLFRVTSIVGPRG